MKKRFTVEDKIDCLIFFFKSINSHRNVKFEFCRKWLDFFFLTSLIN